MPSRSLVLVTCFALIGGTGKSLAQKTEDAKPAKPPAGWKEHSPRDGTYVVWIPEKTNKQSERERTTKLGGGSIRINALTILAGGTNYVVEEAILSPAIAKQYKKAELEDLFRDMVASEAGGKVTDDTDVKSDNVTGKEYRIEGGKSVARARVYVTNTRVFLLRVSGTKDQVDSDNAKTFLESGRLTAANKASARGPRIQGGGNDPEFKDASPENGLLVGFEVGLTKNSNAVKSIRPVYRVDDKDSTGTQQGTDLDNVIKVIAKPGYAVGGITVKTGLGLDGMQVKFMKIGDGKLDPKDAYDSDWVGGKGGGGPVKIGGDGTLVNGLIGRTNANSKDVTGLGLVYKETEKSAASTEKK